MGFRVEKRGKGPFRFTKSYSSAKKAERAKRRLKGKRVVRS
jgi:hypothetical protein